MPEGHKYTDRVVREDTRLTPIALEYVRGYTGDFELLVHARDVLRAYGSLPPGVIRAVLNCMRTDPRGFHLLPTDSPMEVFDDLTRLSSELPARAHLRVVREPADNVVRIRQQIELKVNWRLPYLLSTHKNAQVAHLLRPRKCSLKYWPPGSGREVYSCFSVWLHSWCSWNAVSHNTMKPGFKAMMSEDTQGRRVCGTCQTNFNAYGGNE